MHKTTQGYDCAAWADFLVSGSGGLSRAAWRASLEAALVSHGDAEVNLTPPDDTFGGGGSCGQSGRASYTRLQRDMVSPARDGPAVYCVEPVKANSQVLQRATRHEPWRSALRAIDAAVVQTAGANATALFPNSTYSAPPLTLASSVVNIVLCLPSTCPLLSPSTTTTHPHPHPPPPHPHHPHHHPERRIPPL